MTPAATGNWQAITGCHLTDDLSEVIEGLLRQYSYLRDRVLEDRELFLINRAAEEYISMFRYVIANHQID